MLFKACTAAILCAVALALFSPGVSADCVMRGQCGFNQNKPTAPSLNCKYDGEAEWVDSPDSIAILEEVCPHVFETSDHSEVMLCCDDNQIQSMYTDLQQIIGLFGRCPQCLYNFYRFICETTCSPRQSEFMNVIGTNELVPGLPIFQVTEVNYYLDDDFANGLFNSCSNVLFPSTGQRVVEVMCQNAGFGGENCAVSQFLQGTGNVEVAQVPFQMTHCFSGNDIKGNCKENEPVDVKPLKGPIFECYKPLEDVTYWEDESPCSCSDCREVCPIQIAKEPEPVCKIEGFDCIFFYCMIAAAVAFLLMLVICVYISMQQGKEKEEKAPAKPSWRQKVSYKIDQGLRRIFYRWGYFCATNSVMILIIGLLVSAIFILAIILINRPPITDPVELWAAPSSRTKQEKDYFDNHFRPFYRTTQLIFRPLSYELVESQYTGECLPGDDEFDFIKYPNNPTMYSNVSGVFRYAFLDAVFKLQLDIMKLTTQYQGETVTLKDVCFKPLEPDVMECTITSVFNFFQNSYEKFNEERCIPRFEDDLTPPLTNFNSKLDQCLLTPTELGCLGDFGGPVFPWVALGGFGGGAAYKNATAIIITILLNNEVKADEYDTSAAGAAKAWEKMLVAYLHNYTAHMSLDHRDPAAFTYSFLTERSIEDEIDRQSNADQLTIVISYVVMFGYIAIALGQYRPLSHILINVKPTLGVAGVLIVTFSVTSSIGFYNFVGTRMTLIILEVVPFLVLAVGVDNIFIVVQTYQRASFPKDMPVEERVAEIVSEIGPSMLLTSISEATAFFLGALTDMPAVYIFSLYAGMAVFMNFLLQISCFVCLLAIDARRTAAGRLDVLCCIKSTCVDKDVKMKPGFVYTIFEKLYAPILFNKFIRPIILPIFLAVGILAGGLIPSVGLGLDQKLSMPLDSYVLRYLNDFDRYLEVGAPVYFVVKDGYDYLRYDSATNQTLSQNAICGASGCDPDSLVSQLVLAAQKSAETRLATPPMAWLDEYYDWYKSCCSVFKTNFTYCPSKIAKDPVYSDQCGTCSKTLGNKKRVPNEYFMPLLTEFLNENPTEACPKGGHAAYAASVELRDNGKTLGATNFMTYHTVLKSSVEFTDGLRQTYKIAEDISKVTRPYGAEVFPYCITYVYYEQYLTIVNSTLLNVGVSLAAVFLISFVLLGIDAWAAFILILVIAFVIVDMLACMFLWEIELNAVSLVNLVMCVGITVEFCSHLIRHFVLSELEGRYERARHSLEQMGSSVFSGITLTKLGGIIVLGFSTSRLFQVFYFRMFLLMVVLGAAHGLIFLPILLSYFGPPSNPMYRQKKDQPSEKQPSVKAEAANQIAMVSYPAQSAQPVGLPRVTVTTPVPPPAFQPYYVVPEKQSSAYTATAPSYLPAGNPSVKDSVTEL